MELDQIGYLAMWMGKSKRFREQWEARLEEDPEEGDIKELAIRLEIKWQTRTDKKMMHTSQYEKCWIGAVPPANWKTDGWHVRKGSNNCIERKKIQWVLVQIDRVILERFGPTVTKRVRCSQGE